jgi:hypothetical protein
MNQQWRSSRCQFLNRQRRSSRCQFLNRQRHSLWLPISELAATL